MSDSGNQFNQSLDNINSLLAITNEQEMSQKISQNIPILFQIFNSFKTKLNYGQIITPNDISKVIEALKFVDNLNLFIEENEVRKFKDKMMEIRDLLKKRNYDFKDSILKQINYTEMTIISHKKLYFRDLYFNNHEGLSDEIKNELDQVYKGNKFDFKLFKQMQNIFWVVKNVIDENKKIELDNRLKNMKNESQKIKEKKFGSSSYLGRGYQSNYINDYKNYSGYDYNDNFIRNDDNNSYYNKNYINRNYHYSGRGGYMNNSNRKYHIKKQEEKEIEIPSDPSYYYKGKESDLKLDEIGENNVNNYNNIQDYNNNYISQDNNDNINNINGGNDLLENNNNEINLNGANGDEINIIQTNNNNTDLIQNNGGNGELNNVNNENINSNEINQNKDIEIIKGNQVSSSYNRNYLNKMIAVELPPSNEENIENNTNEENNNNGAKINESNNISNENNNIENHYINNNYNYNGENNIEYRQYNNDYRDNKYKNYKYNIGYKSNNYNKSGYRNNNYNRYNIRNNISGNNYGENNNNKRLLFVEIDTNNNPIENKSENNEIENGQGNNEIIQNEPNGEVLSNEYIDNNKNEDINLNINKEEKIENNINNSQNINEIKEEGNKEKENNEDDNGEIIEIKKEEDNQNEKIEEDEKKKIDDIKIISENMNIEEDMKAKISKSDSNLNKAQYVDQIKMLKTTYVDSNIKVKPIDDIEHKHVFSAEGFNTNITQYIEDNMPEHLTPKYALIKDRLKEK